MLYQLWRQIARAHRREIALFDVASCEDWTFEQLEKEAERHSIDQTIVCPRGITAEFVLDVLGAWREGKVVCPLELKQGPPEGLNSLPSGTVHLKTTSASTGAPRLIDGIWVGAFALLVSFVATLYPSWSASRILPAEALRYE